MLTECSLWAGPAPRRHAVKPSARFRCMQNHSIWAALRRPPSRLVMIVSHASMANPYGWDPLAGTLWLGPSGGALWLGRVVGPRWKMLSSECIRQELFQRYRSVGCIDEQVRASCLVEELTTATARPQELAMAVDNAYGHQPICPRTMKGTYEPTLCAQREPVRGVLDVATTHGGVVVGQPGCTDVQMGIRGVGARSSLDGCRSKCRPINAVVGRHHALASKPTEWITKKSTTTVVTSIRGFLFGVGNEVHTTIARRWRQKPEPKVLSVPGPWTLDTIRTGLYI